MPKNNNKYLEQRINTRFSTFLDSINFGRMEFLDGVAERMARLQSSGLSEDAIVETLYKEMLSTDGGTLAKLEKSEANDLWDFMKGASQDTVFAELDEEAQYRWVVNPGAQHCKGCMDRNGQIKTLEEWYAIGVPGSGDTDCYYNCMCDLVEVKEKPFSTRIKGRDIKGLDADIEARNNWKKAVADASNNVLKDKEDFIKLAEEKYNIPISGKPDRLSEENQKDIYNVVKSITEDIRPDILKDLTDIKFVKIRGNSAGQYHRDTKEIKINLNYYDKDESHKKSIRGNNQTHAEELKSTFAHELGHLVHRNNILINDSIAKFYQENKKAIEKYYKYVEKNIGLREHLSKSDSEFFAEAFSRYCTGKLAESKDIPAIKKETELIRNFMKEMITKLKEGEK